MICGIQVGMVVNEGVAAVAHFEECDGSVFHGLAADPAVFFFPADEAFCAASLRVEFLGAGHEEFLPTIWANFARSFLRIRRYFGSLLTGHESSMSFMTAC